MYEKIIVDADICIKLGCSKKYPFLKEVLPLLANEIFMHYYAFNEIITPGSAKQQLEDLISQNKLILVNEMTLNSQERHIYDMIFNQLTNVMIDPRRPNKNKGEVCSLAYAKVKGIPIFVTDECDLQPIIDTQLNTGLNDIHCLRIIDIIKMGKNGEINLPRKKAKNIWLISKKDKTEFDCSIWPIL
ncbi:MAG: hypothetical protein ACOX43_07180 [Bacilli bacterium]|jgi:hypothetical protein